MLNALDSCLKFSFLIHLWYSIKSLFCWSDGFWKVKLFNNIFLSQKQKNNIQLRFSLEQWLLAK